MRSLTDPVSRAIANAGGAEAFARKLTAIGSPTSTNGIKQWALIPRRKLRAVSVVTGISPSELRPDRTLPPDRRR
jgi:DNA-binding transcriptional regulator YdaS (Cro superfamily)